MDESHLSSALNIEQRTYEFPWTEGIFRDSLRAGYSSWVVTSPEQQVLAYALMTLAAGEAHILNLCVDPAVQRQGLGRFLLSHLQRVARGGGAELLLLEVRKSNRAAITLYLKSGFHQLGQRKNYYPAHTGAEDAWLLAYDLKSKTATA